VLEAGDATPLPKSPHLVAILSPPRSSPSIRPRTANRTVTSLMNTGLGVATLMGSCSQRPPAVASRIRIDPSRQRQIRALNQAPARASSRTIGGQPAQRPALVLGVTELWDDSTVQVGPGARGRRPA
jgi:hypothetical protein